MARALLYVQFHGGRVVLYRYSLSLDSISLSAWRLVAEWKTMVLGGPPCMTPFCWLSVSCKRVDYHHLINVLALVACVYAHGRDCHICVELRSVTVSQCVEFPPARLFYTVANEEGTVGEDNFEWHDTAQRSQLSSLDSSTRHSCLA